MARLCFRDILDGDNDAIADLAWRGCSRSQRKFDSRKCVTVKEATLISRKMQEERAYKKRVTMRKELALMDIEYSERELVVRVKKLCAVQAQNKWLGLLVENAELRLRSPDWRYEEFSAMVRLKDDLYESGWMLLQAKEGLADAEEFLGKSRLRLSCC